MRKSFARKNLIFLSSGFLCETFLSMRFLNLFLQTVNGNKEIVIKLTYGFMNSILKRIFYYLQFFHPLQLGGNEIRNLSKRKVWDKNVFLRKFMKLYFKYFMLLSSLLAYNCRTCFAVSVKKILFLRRRHTAHIPNDLLSSGIFILMFKRRRWRCPFAGRGSNMCFWCMTN